MSDQITPRQQRAIRNALRALYRACDGLSLEIALCLHARLLAGIAMQEGCPPDDEEVLVEAVTDWMRMAFADRDGLNERLRTADQQRSKATH